MLLAALLGPLALPGRLLMVRDLAFFHLPLRQAAAALVRRGELPEWNRLLHGGQPILSNPNYAAFYAPTWLGLLLPQAYALQLLVLAHAAWALAGAWRLLRRLGCSRQSAALGAMGFAASGWFLSLTSTFNFFCSMAWFPWLLACGLAAIESEGAWGGAALATAGGLALQLLAGEPVAVLISGAALATLALGRRHGIRRAIARLAAIALLASLLGSVQLLPTAFRLAGTARGAGLSALEADRWSSPPRRLVDFVLPRFWGDANRDEEGLWFGWGIHDRDFPYIVSLYSGLLLTLLAIAALLRWPIPHRAAWGVAAVGGVLLALGRYDPLWEPLRHAVPLLAVVRYPEKFAVLTAAVVPIAGALGWEHLLRARPAGGRQWTFPLALVAILGTAVALFCLVLVVRPAAGEDFIRAHSGLPPSPRALAAGLLFLRREAVLALLLAFAVAALLAALGQRRLPARGITGAALLLLAGDLWWYGRDLAPTLLASVLAPPPAVEEVRRAGGRLFSSVYLDTRQEINLRQGPRGFEQLWGRVQRLDPYVASLWGIEYAFDPDYDLMLTPWGRHGLTLMRRAWPARAPVDRLLGAWDVGAIVVRRDPREMMAELRGAGQAARPFAVLAEPSRLPRFRFVRRVDAVPDAAAAIDALPALDLARSDLCVGGRGAAGVYGPATLLGASEGQAMELKYRAADAAYLVAAITFDDGWRATLEDGTVLAPCATALGQVGIALPAGDHVVRMRYRDPWVRVGAAMTLTTLLVAALAALRRRPRRAAVESLP